MDTVPSIFKLQPCLLHNLHPRYLFCFFTFFFIVYLVNEITYNYNAGLITFV
jgi:hypothetical protein